MHVRELRGQVPERAASHAVARALGLEDAIEEATDLRQRPSSRIREAWVQRLRDEGGHDLIKNRVTEVFLAPEVVIEAALAHAALREQIVQRRGVVALDLHETLGSRDDHLSGLLAFPRARSG